MVPRSRKSINRAPFSVPKSRRHQFFRVLCLLDFHRYRQIDVNPLARFLFRFLDEVVAPRFIAHNSGAKKFSALPPSP